MDTREKFTMFGIIFIIVSLMMTMLCGQFTEATLILPDPQTNGVLYGNAYAYSLPILAYFYDAQFGGGVGPGNPYYIVSTPGAIKNDIVVATGTNGTGITTNFPGMNDVYSTPSGTGGDPYFSTGQTTLHPAAETGLLMDNPTTWNTNIAALESFLGTGMSPIFKFNNNQTDSSGALAQQLAIWGQAILVSSTNAASPEYFTFANNCPTGNICINGSVFPAATGGIVSGPDKNPYLYSRGAPDSTYPLVAAAGSNPALADFVLSGGQDCLDVNGILVSCSSPLAVTTINHNLGANQAAYALIIPGLNDFLSSWTTSSPYDVLELDIRMGSFDPITGLALNNGYEQIFIEAGTVQVPEPSTLFLLGAGLLGLGLFGRSIIKKNN